MTNDNHPFFKTKEYWAFKIHDVTISKSQFFYFIFFACFLTPAGLNIGLLHLMFAFFKYAIGFYFVIKIGLATLCKTSSHLRIFVIIV